jgi:uncharacterized protein with von Willebrand factor type A (vWA) domain
MAVGKRKGEGLPKDLPYPPDIAWNGIKKRRTVKAAVRNGITIRHEERQTFNQPFEFKLGADPRGMMRLCIGSAHKEQVRSPRRVQAAESGFEDRDYMLKMSNRLKHPCEFGFSQNEQQTEASFRVRICLK